MMKNQNSSNLKEVVQEVRTDLQTCLMEMVVSIFDRWLIS